MSRSRYTPSSHKTIHKEIRYGKKGFVLCVCQGTCPSLAKMDIFGVLYEIRREKISTAGEEQSN